MSAISSSPSRFESALTVASIAMMALGLISIVLSLIVGMGDRFAVAEGFWPVIYGVAFFGLPIGFVILIATIVLAQRRRKLALRDGGTPGA